MINIENHSELFKYLIKQELISKSEPPAFENLHGGVSNRTVLIRLPRKKAWVAKQALEKLRVKEDWFSEPERIHHEAHGLRQLATLTSQHSVPCFIFEDRNEHVLIMEAVPEPHTNYKTLLLEKPPERKHTEDFAHLLADIHLNSNRKKETLSTLFNDTRFFENLRLEPYYAFSATRLPAAQQFLHNLIDQTRERTLTLVHGDYSPKNILIHNNRLILLDHEVIHFGDPAFDIGFAMAHFLSKAHYRVLFRSAFITTAEIFWQTYFARTATVPWAKDLESHCTNHLLGCLLARAIGKSPLEYLDDEHREIQKASVLTLMKNNIQTIQSLVKSFWEQLEHHEQNQKPEGI